MKTRLALIAVGLSCSVAGAQETGRVVSSTPVIVQQGIPTQVCEQTPANVYGRHYGSGAAIGAIAGGVIGNQIGHGSGRVASTVIGAIGGAVVGERIESGAHAGSHALQRCTTYTSHTDRVVHYDVVYEYGGRHYSARLPYEPGPSIDLQVAPVHVVPAPAAPTVHYYQSQPWQPNPNVFIAVTPHVRGGHVHPRHHHHHPHPALNAQPQPYPRYHPHGPNRNPWQ